MRSIDLCVVIDSIFYRIKNIRNFDELCKICGCIDWVQKLYGNGQIRSSEMQQIRFDEMILTVFYVPVCLYVGTPDGSWLLVKQQEAYSIHSIHCIISILHRFSIDTVPVRAYVFCKFFCLFDVNTKYERSMNECIFVIAFLACIFVSHPSQPLKALNRTNRTFYVFLSILMGRYFHSSSEWNVQ